mgnify:CR=1 FL=1
MWVKISQTIKSEPIYKTKVVKGKCFSCGRMGHQRNQCRFRNEICKFYGKKGHIREACFAKIQKGTIQIHVIAPPSSEKNYSSDDYEIIYIKNDDCVKTLMIDIRMHLGPIKFEVDTDSGRTIIPYNVWKRLSCDNKPRTNNSNIMLRDYGGNEIKVIGTYPIQMSRKDAVETIDCIIVESTNRPLLGRDAIKRFKLQIEECYAIEQPDYIKEFPNVFNSDDNAPVKSYEVKLLIKSDVSPIFCKARRVPYALEPKVDLELDRLQKQGIL